MECFIHVACIYSNLVEQIICLQKKRVQLPQDRFRTPTWPPFRVLEHEYGRCNALYYNTGGEDGWVCAAVYLRCPIRYFCLFVCLFAIPSTILTAAAACNNVTKNNVVGQLENFLRSLSSEDFARRTLTGSGLYGLLNRDFEQILGQIVSTRVKTLSNASLVASRDFEREKGSIPVGVRRSKTSLLITSSGATTGGSSIASRETWV